MRVNWYVFFWHFATFTRGLQIREGPACWDSDGALGGVLISVRSCRLATLACPASHPASCLLLALNGHAPPAT